MRKDRLILVGVGVLVALGAHAALQTTGPFLFLGVVMAVQALFDIYLRFKSLSQTTPFRGWKKTQRGARDFWRAGFAGAVFFASLGLSSGSQVSGAFPWIQVGALGWFVMQLAQVWVPLKRA